MFPTNKQATQNVWSLECVKLYAVYAGAAVRGRRGRVEAEAARSGRKLSSHTHPSSDFEGKWNLIDAQVIAAKLMLWYNSYSIKCWRCHRTLYDALFSGSLEHLSLHGAGVVHVHCGTNWKHESAITEGELAWIEPGICSLILISE